MSCVTLVPTFTAPEPYPLTLAFMSKLSWDGILYMPHCQKWAKRRLRNRPQRDMMQKKGGGVHDEKRTWYRAVWLGLLPVQ